LISLEKLLSNTNYLRSQVQFWRGHARSRTVGISMLRLRDNRSAPVLPNIGLALRILFLLKN
jgi:hypothetical protein